MSKYPACSGLASSAPEPGPRSPRRPRTSTFVVGFAALFMIAGTVGCGHEGASAPPNGTFAPAAAEASMTAKATPTPSLASTSGETSNPLDSEPPNVAAQGDAGTAPKTQPAFARKALELLASLPVKGRAPKTGYDRALFGQAWADVDRNGCDTRNDILKRDLTGVKYTNSVPCKVRSGTLVDPYTGTTINFQRGTATSSAVQIDHVVALSDAWQKGAQQLTTERRTAFANDPLNLQATDGPTNIKKGDGDTATWLPPNKGFRCEYVARQISVKARYKLWVTRSEHDAMTTILGNCSSQPAATNRKTPQAPTSLPPVAPAPDPVAPAPAPQVPLAPAPAAAYYANCAAAKAAGAAPIHAGQAGYRAALDRDKDGIACER